MIGWYCAPGCEHEPELQGSNFGSPEFLLWRCKVCKSEGVSKVCTHKNAVDHGSEFGNHPMFGIMCGTRAWCPDCGSRRDRFGNWKKPEASA